MINAFYDGKCGLCRREIEHYKRIAPLGVFSWHDITTDSSVIERLGISYADGLRLLHVQDENGRVYAGVDAFLVIWRQMARWRILARIVSFPLIRPLANAAYRIFAAWRFRRLAHCQLALGNVEENKKYQKEAP